MRTQHTTSTGSLWPTTAAGRLSLVFAAGFAALFAWVMFLDPIVGALIGQETTGITDSWVTPRVMVLLVDAAAVAGLVGHVRGDRTILAQVVMWVSAATGALWTVIAVGTFLAEL